MVWTGRQFHNQPEASHQHSFLVDLWYEVRTRSQGKVHITVHPKNGGEAGSDPRVLDMVASGELEFATMMGPLIAAKVPAAEIQGVPFAFSSSAQVHQALDGLLGKYLRHEMALKHIYLLPCGTLENGFRQICSVEKPVRSVADLEGYRMRVPAGQVYADLFTELGAHPAVFNIDRLHDALAQGWVDGHENPLAITEVNELYKVTKFIAITNHVWSGFNLIANLKFWNSLPHDAQEIIHAAVLLHVARQRESTVQLNRDLQTKLAERGMQIERVDATSFRNKLGAGFYRRLRERCGNKAWTLLQEAVGKLPG